MDLLSKFSDVEIVETVENLARKHFPNTKPFYDFMLSLLPKDCVVIDKNTGEILKDTYANHRKGDLANRTFWSKYKEIEREKGADYRGEFVMLYRESFMNEKLQLTNIQHTTCAKLYTKMEYNGILKNKGKPMDRDDVGKFLGYEKTSHDSSFRRGVLDGFTKNKVLLSYKIKGFGNKNFYKFNPEYVFKGKGGPDEKFLKLFQKTWANVIKLIEKRENSMAHLNKKKKYNSAIGTLHAITPYCHYQSLHFTKYPTTNICKNGEGIQEAIVREALKKNRKKHILLTHTDMRKAAVRGNKIGLNKKTFESHMQILKDIGVLYLEESGGSNNYILFPLLAFSHVGDGKDSYTTDVIKKFYKTWGKNKEKRIKGLGLEGIEKHFPELKPKED